MPATKFTITGNAAQVAGAFQTITITADDVGYVGDHTLTFSGAADAAFGNPISPQTVDKDANPVDFGDPCPLTFVLGVATTDMTLVKAETVDIACTDGTIAAGGADRLNVVVTAGVALNFDWNASGAAQVAGVGFTIPTINAVDGWGNIDLTYGGSKNLTFTGIGDAPDTTKPTISNDAGVAKNFGQVTSITFIAGVAVADATQLDAVFYAAGLAQLMTFTEGAITAYGNETAGFLVPKTVDVTENILDHFALVMTTGQISTQPFTGSNDVTAQDLYDNPITTFDASVDNVVISPNGGFAAGVITGLGSGGLATLDQAGDFTNGVANFTSALVLTIAAGATDTFTATSTIGAKVGTSNAFGLSAKFVITGGAAQVTGAINPITITADNASYVGSHVLVFSGANNPPLTASPSTTDSGASPVVFGLGCGLTFAAGVATSDMVLTKAETVDIACTDGFIAAAGADRLNVVVTADVAIALDFKTDNGATVVAGVQFQILEIRAIDTYGNIDLTYDFPGGKNITFEAAPFINPAPDGTNPTVTDRLAAVINFGIPTSLVFNTGQAVADGIQLKVILYDAELAQLIRLTDGVLTSVLAEGGGFLAPKEVDVLADALDHFVFVLGASQQYTVPFIGVNTLTAQDAFDNVVILFDASADNVVVSPDPPLVGVVSGLGSLANDTLDQAGDFVLGVATLTGLLVYTGTGDGTFTATSTIGAKTGTSNAVGFNLSSQGNPILIDSVMVLSYQNSGSAPNNLQIYPRAIKWDNPGAAGHEVTITDINGQVLFNHTAQAQFKGCYVRLNRGGGGGGNSVRWKDFIVTKIDSGELYIWYSS